MALMPEAARGLHFAVRPRVLAHYVGLLMVPFALLLAVPAGYTLLEGRTDAALRFGIAVALLLALAWPCALLRTSEEIQTNEALSIAALAFTISSLVSALALTGYGLDGTTALFEAVSGITSTGLTTLGTVEGLPRSFLFARAWLQWVGGLGIVVLALALLIDPTPAATELGYGQRDRVDVFGGTRSHARRALAVYLVLTLIGIVALLALGVAPFEAVAHVLTAVSTAGFSTHDDSLAGLAHPAAAAVLMLLALLGAVSFTWYYGARHRGWRKTLGERRLHALLLACLLVTLALFLIEGEDAAAPLGERVYNAVMMAVTAQTTTGFSVVSVGAMEDAEKLVLIGSMMVGGEVGSTAGGLKILRLLLILRLLQLALSRVSLPRSARLPTRFGDDILGERQIETLLAILVGYLVTILVAWFLFLLHGHDALDALFDVVSAVCTVGLSTGVTAPDLEPLLKMVLTVIMLMGRLETVAFVVLFFPGTWIGRRRPAR